MGEGGFGYGGGFEKIIDFVMDLVVVYVDWYVFEVDVVEGYVWFCWGNGMVIEGFVF